ncbi:MAG: lysylphosphatidylglycerol synthase transmembrane domain-containing protein [Anaerolineae bacterium]
MKRRVRLAIGMAISLIFLYFTVRNIDWAQLAEAFRTAHYGYLIPAFILLALISLARAWRWRLLMGEAQPLSLLRVFHLVNIGYFFNNIFPAKAGELVRAYLAGRSIQGGIGRALSTLLIERLLDVLSVAVLLVVLIPFVELPSWATTGGLLFGAAAVGGTICLLVLSRFGERGVAWLWRFVGRIPLVGHPKVREALTNLLEGFGVLRDRRLLPGILLGSVLVWVGYATFNYTFLLVFGMSELPYAAAALVLCATGFIMVLPSSPGAMGVFEWAGVQALAVYGIGTSQSFSYTLGLHVFTNLVLIALGMYGLFSEGISYASVRGEALANAGAVTTANDTA